MPIKRYGKKTKGTDKGGDLHVRIGNADMARLKEIMANTGKSKSDIIRTAITLYAELYNSP